VKLYQGIPPHTVLVLPTKTSSRPLPLCLDVRNHSQTGFSWGYLGSGPAQLALAICVDAVGRERALDVYQGFKLRLIAQLPGDQPWMLTEHDVRTAIAVIEGQLRGVTP